MSAPTFLPPEALDIDTVAPDEFITEIDFDAINNVTSPEGRLEHMIALGRYDHRGPLITGDHFPVIGVGKHRFRNKTFHFGVDLRAWEAIESMSYFGFMPGDHIQGLELGAAFPGLQLKGVIACLGYEARINGTAHVMTLFRHRKERHLRCRDRDGTFLDHWRFLGVQEITG